MIYKTLRPSKQRDSKGRKSLKMKKSNTLFTLIAIFSVCLILLAESYKFIGLVDTSNGYCENERFGRIRVGDTYYNDEECEQIECTQGSYVGQGCGQSELQGNPNCRLVSRPGHYPNCCKDHIECDEGADMSNVVVSSVG